ncbi:MAG: type II secretion system protein [Bacilli bacterium]|nr:type II secretion system protein [Bacilli bacterium]
MKKKGFTLVELLAVIAILAILVIVAMPNVLGMFNQAKANSFVTEVQKYMDTAKTGFMQQAMLAGGKEIVFTAVDSTLGTETTAATSGAANVKVIGALDMDGAPKNYVIWFDRNGGFKRVVIYDNNFCYDSQKAGFNATTMDKSKVDVKQVYERSTDDKVGMTTYNASGTGNGGCNGTVPAKTN